MTNTALHSVTDITIDALGGLGDGIARLNGKPLYVPKSCTGDRLKIRVTHETKDKLQGEIIDILSPGPHRQQAPCPAFADCGGCTLQQLTPEYYQQLKTGLLHAALARAGCAIPSAEVIFLPEHTRRRVEFKIHHTSQGIALGFYALRSHNAVTVSSCLVLHPKLEAMISPLNSAISALPFAAHITAVGLTLADSGIDMLLTIKNHALHSISPLEPLCAALGLQRICLRQSDTAPVVNIERSPVYMELGGHKVPLPPESFLQAAAEAQTLLTDIVLQTTHKAHKAIDLFSGIGTYAFPLSRHTHVHAVEGDAHMVQSMRQSITRYGIKNLSCDVRDLFRHPLRATELQEFDTAILNPPRIGAKAQTEHVAASRIRTVVMISCNPATFERDAKILKNAGFRIETACGIDQFVYSPHLEIAAVFHR